MSTYDSDSKTLDWEEFDFPDRTNRDLIMTIWQSLSYLLGANLDKRRKQKLREGLVHEHIEGKQHPTSFLKTKFSQTIYFVGTNLTDLLKNLVNRS